MLWNSFGEVMVSRVSILTDARTECRDMWCNRGFFLLKLSVTCSWRLYKSCERCWSPMCAVCWCFGLSVDSRHISASQWTRITSFCSTFLVLFSTTQKETLQPGHRQNHVRDVEPSLSAILLRHPRHLVSRNRCVHRKESSSVVFVWLSTRPVLFRAVSLRPPIESIHNQWDKE